MTFGGGDAAVVGRFPVEVLGKKSHTAQCGDDNPCIDQNGNLGREV